MYDVCMYVCWYYVYTFVCLYVSGMTGLLLHHREAQKCVMLFFETIVGLPSVLIAKRYKEADIELAQSLVVRCVID